MEITIIATKYKRDQIDTVVEEIYGKEAWYDENDLLEDEDYEEERKKYNAMLCVYTDEEELQDDQIGTLYINKDNTISYHEWF